MYILISNDTTNWSYLALKTATISLFHVANNSRLLFAIPTTHNKTLNLWYRMNSFWTIFYEIYTKFPLECTRGLAIFFALLINYSRGRSSSRFFAIRINITNMPVYIFSIYFTKKKKFLLRLDSVRLYAIRLLHFVV